MALVICNLCHIVTNSKMSNSCIFKSRHCFGNVRWLLYFSVFFFITYTHIEFSVPEPRFGCFSFYCSVLLLFLPSKYEHSSIRLQRAQFKFCVCILFVHDTYTLSYEIRENRTRALFSSSFSPFVYISNVLKYFTCCTDYLVFYRLVQWFYSFYSPVTGESGTTSDLSKQFIPRHNKN